MIPQPILHTVVDIFQCAYYGLHMVEVVQSSEFKDWLLSLRDRQARVRIIGRITRMEAGNPGNVAPVGQGISEMRIRVGAGYRVYFMQRGTVIIVLLCGGDKSTQPADIVRAKVIADEWREP